MERKNENSIGVSIESLYRGDKLLIEDSEIDISSNEKIALIGRNGSGKSTLLETIYTLSKEYPLDDSIDFIGKIDIPKISKTGYLQQDVRLEYEGSLRDYIDFQMGEKAEIYNRYKSLVEQDSKADSHQEELINILTLMEQYSLWNYELDITTVLNGLSIPQSFLNRQIRTLSGGEATKVALAAILISKPDLILLDEPTNNLDLKNIKFLEEWFRKTKTSLIVVSHDREFLNNVINTIWEIDEETKKIIKFGGNYSFYEEEKRKQFEGRVRDFEEQEKTKNRLEGDIKRLHTQANRFENMSNNDFYRAKGAKIAKSAKVRERRVETQLSKLGKPEKPKLPKFILRETNPLEGTIININNLSHNYSEKKVIQNLSLKIEANDRTSISGSNGVGKSTLLKLIVGDINNQDISLRKDAKIGYIPQSIIPQNPKQDILSYMREHTVMNEDDLIDILGKVIFSNPTHLTVGDFSIGELKRIQLAIIFASSPNLLILDEPTNHLDIHTLNMLERTLKEYKHTLIVVSHDREFLKRIGIKKDILLK